MKSAGSHSSAKAPREPATLAIRRRVGQQERGEPNPLWARFATSVYEPGRSSTSAGADGLRGAPQALPHGAAIKRAFGRYDVQRISAHVGGAAAEASEALGARAYAFGGAVAFAADPDLYTAAHEAAHVVQQQRGGVQLADGVGARGDAYERHADAVADKVCAGESAERLLARGPGGAAGPAAVQLAEGDAPAAAPAPAATPSSADRWLAALEDAVARGRDEVWAVIDQGQEVALAVLPDASLAVLDALWPSNTGWRFTGNLQGAGFLGAGIGITLAASGTASISVVRSGREVELKFASEGGVGGAGGAHLGLEGDVGVIPVRGAATVTLTTDLAKVAWPSAMLAALRDLNPGGAMTGLLSLGDDYWQHTRVEIEGEEGMDLVGGLGLGMTPVAEAGVGGSVGVVVGARETIDPDGTTVKEMTVDLEGAISLAAEISPTLRDALSGLQQDLGNLAPMLAPVMRPLDPDAPALRGGDLLPGPSDSANSVNVEGALGVKFRRTIPADGSPGVWEGGFAASVSGVLALLGQSVGGGVEAEVMYPFDDFVQLVRYAAQNARSGLSPAIGAPPGVTPTDWSVGGHLELELEDLTQFGAFPGLDIGSLPGVADRVDAVRARLEASFKLDTYVIPGRPPGDLGALLDGARARAEADQIVDAILFVLRGIPGLAGTSSRTALEVILDELTLELTATDEAFFDLETPGFGEIPSGKSQGGVRQSDVYRFRYGAGAPELSPAALARLLLDMVL